MLEDFFSSTNMALPHCQATAQQERGRMAAAPKRAQDELVKTWQVVFCEEMAYTVCEEMCGVQNDVTSLLFR